MTTLNSNTSQVYFSLFSSLFPQNCNAGKKEQQGRVLAHLSQRAEAEETTVGGNEYRNGTFGIYRSQLSKVVENEVRAKPQWSIGPDSVVIKCNWLLIGHNALF